MDPDLPPDNEGNRVDSASVLRDLLDAMAEGVVEATPEGKLLVANRAFAEMLGYDDPEQLRRSVTNVSELHARPEERPAQVSELSDAGRQVVDLEMVRRDGTTVWVRARAVAHKDPSGTVTSLSAVIEDISAIREAERRLDSEREWTRLAFDRNPVPLAVVGVQEDGVVGWVAVNGAVERVFGYPPGELIKVSPTEVMDPATLESELQLLDRLMAEAKGAVVEIETRRRRADDSFFPARIRATTFTSGAGETYTIGALEDLTEVKAAESAIRELARQRYQLLHQLVALENQERERMAADVHDHLIQLLVTASLRLQVVLEEEPTSGVADALTAVNAATRRLRGLLRHLEPVVDSASVPSAVRSTAHHLFDGTDVVVEVVGALQDAPPSTTSVLLHCVREALTNARSHARAGLVEVRLRSDEYLHEAVVRDDGDGIDPGAPERPGHRGLRNMRTRAEAVGGTLAIGPVAGGGTEVRVVVPREPVFEEPESAPTGRVLAPHA